MRLEHHNERGRSGSLRYGSSDERECGQRRRDGGKQIPARVEYGTKDRSGVGERVFVHALGTARDVGLVCQEAVLDPN
jgi:hypothetical protein